MLSTRVVAATLLLVGVSGFNRLPLTLPRTAPEMRNRAAPVDEVAVAEQRGELDLVDEVAMIRAAGFPISPDALVDAAKEFIACNYGAGNVDILDADFEFIGPFIGPMARTPYVEALGGALNPKDGFPDLRGRQFGFTVDPLEPGRVWWFTRPTGTFTGEFMEVQGDGRRVEPPPQSMGVVVSPAGKILKFNMGTPIDRTSGNTGGLGGLFSYLYFVGKPLPVPENQPYSQSWQLKLLSKIGQLLRMLPKRN